MTSVTVLPKGELYIIHGYCQGWESPLFTTNQGGINALCIQREFF
jgi:hypothetical protein